MNAVLILGKDAHEVHRSLECNKTTRSEKFAVLIELGWVVNQNMAGETTGNICHLGFKEDVKNVKNSKNMEFRNLCYQIECRQSVQE